MFPLLIRGSACFLFSVGSSPTAALGARDVAMARNTQSSNIIQATLAAPLVDGLHVVSVEAPEAGLERPVLGNQPLLPGQPLLVPRERQDVAAELRRVNAAHLADPFVAKPALLPEVRPRGSQPVLVHALVGTKGSAGRTNRSFAPPAHGQAVIPLGEPRCAHLAGSRAVPPLTVLVFRSTFVEPLKHVLLARPRFLGRLVGRLLFGCGGCAWHVLINTNPPFTSSSAPPKATDQHPPLQ